MRDGGGDEGRGVDGTLRAAVAVGLQGGPDRTVVGVELEDEADVSRLGCFLWGMRRGVLVGVVVASHDDDFARAESVVDCEPCKGILMPDDCILDYLYFLGRWLVSSQNLNVFPVNCK